MKSTPLKTPRPVALRTLSDRVATQHRRVVRLAREHERSGKRLMRARIRLQVLKQLANEELRGRIGAEA